MKPFRFLVIMLAVAVAMAGFNADAKTKRKGGKRHARKTFVQKQQPSGYDYVQGSLDDNVTEAPKYSPEYPGGEEGLTNFLAENIKYPKSAEKNGIQGTVILQFVVEKTGKISNVKVLKSVDKALDREAIRVVKKIKDFIPGYDEDHAPVRVLYTLPVKFSLK